MKVANPAVNRLVIELTRQSVPATADMLLRSIDQERLRINFANQSGWLLVAFKLILLSATSAPDAADQGRNSEVTHDTRNAQPFLTRVGQVFGQSHFRHSRTLSEPDVVILTGSNSRNGPNKTEADCRPAERKNRMMWRRSSMTASRQRDVDIGGTLLFSHCVCRQKIGFRRKFLLGLAVDALRFFSTAQEARRYWPRVNDRRRGRQRRAIVDATIQTVTTPVKPTTCRRNAPRRLKICRLRLFLLEVARCSTGGFASSAIHQVRLIFRVNFTPSAPLSACTCTVITSGCVPSSRSPKRKPPHPKIRRNCHVPLIKEPPDWRARSGRWMARASASTWPELNKAQ